jgi:hypothetical protein
VKGIKASVLVVAVGAVAALAFSGPTVAAQTPAAHPVVVVGIGGLRWSDISPSKTPAIWRLAKAGSFGSLVTTTVHTVTCPDDAWLTLNAGVRAAAPPGGHAACPPVQVAGTSGQILDMNAVTAYNKTTAYQPGFGTLASISRHGGCTRAIGPGAALALGDSSGRVARFLAGLPPSSQAAQLGALFRPGCPLTIVDLGNLAPTLARPVLVATADSQVGRIVEAAQPGSIIVLAGLGDDGSPHLRALVVAGPGYHDGLLTSAATRQPGIVTITDLTPSIFGWRGQQPPAGLVGSAITSSPRGPLAAQVKTMLGQDTANQVYRSIVGWFFLFLGVGEAVLFAIIALVLRGASQDQVRRRVAWYTAAGSFGAALPAGTFLAGLVPWGQFGHPAVWLYGLGAAWAAVIAAGALTGPWRKDPFGPVGFVCAVTLGVIGVDVITGSHLQIGAPFGLSLVEAGRLYGVGNNALGVYVVAGMLTAAWAAVSVLRRRGAAAGARRSAVLAAGAVAAVSVIASGWPGFGAKVGGTIAMVPAYLVLFAAIAGVKITARRGVAIALSGIALVAVFAVLDYVLPAIGPSHLGGFVGQVVHGGAGGTLHRKISSNLHSLTQTWYTPFVPVVAVATGLMLCWPGGPAPLTPRQGPLGKMRQHSFVVAIGREPLIRPTLFAVWLAVVLGWLADDSGVSVAAAALPLALPLAITLVVRIANAPVTRQTAEGGANLALQGNSRVTGQAGDPAHGRFG